MENFIEIVQNYVNNNIDVIIPSDNGKICGYNSRDGFIIVGYDSDAGWGTEMFYDTDVIIKEYKSYLYILKNDTLHLIFGNKK